MQSQLGYELRETEIRSGHELEKQALELSFAQQRAVNQTTRAPCGHLITLSHVDMAT